MPYDKPEIATVAIPPEIAGEFVNVRVATPLEFVLTVTGVALTGETSPVCAVPDHVGVNVTGVF